METVILIIFLVCLTILIWEAVVKTILKDFSLKKIDKILKDNPNIYKKVPLIDQVLEVDDFKGKYMLHINSGESPILVCNTEDKAREISSLWRKHIGEINDEIIQSELEKQGLL